MLKCEDHPKYKGKRRPRIDCLGCWALWILNHQGLDAWGTHLEPIKATKLDIQEALDHEYELMQQEIMERIHAAYLT